MESKNYLKQDETQPLNTVHFKIDNHKELQEFNKIFEEVADESLNQTTLSPLDLIYMGLAIYKNAYETIFNRDERIKELQELCEELRRNNGKVDIEMECNYD